MLKEFRPSIIFLCKFLGVYLLLNFAYGIMVNTYSPSPDPVTKQVSIQCAGVLSLLAGSIDTEVAQNAPKVYLKKDGVAVLAVFEGCNGINVMIIFLAFLFSFGKPSKALLWFVPLGFFVIHLFNLGRVGLLFFVSRHFPHYMYFTHKYLFTAIIYVAVFLLWYFWVMKLNPIKLNNEKVSTKES